MFRRPTLRFRHVSGTMIPHEWIRRSLYPAAGSRRCSDISHRPEQHQWIVLRGDKPSALPKRGCTVIQSVDNHRTATDQARSSHASNESVLQQRRPDAAPNPCGIRRQLAQQQTRHWCWRLPGSNRAWQVGWQNGAGRKTIVADDAASIVHDHHDGEALFLIRERSSLQPVVERRTPTGELRHVMMGSQRFGSRQRHG